MFKTQDILNKEYINILGIGQNGKVGELGDAVGFQKYASTLHRAKMTIGKVIGMRNSLSWLDKTGLELTRDRNQVSTRLIKDLPGL